MILPFTANALSATTVNVIQGTAPYLTFDGGITKTADTEGLLTVRIIDAGTETVYTKGTNSSTLASPIKVTEGQTLSDTVKMLLPTGSLSASLSTVLSSNNYWADGDGDIGLSSTGTLSATILDVDGASASLSSVLDSCKAPYKITLTASAGILTTTYGLPKSTSLTGSSTIYYIGTKGEPKACSASSSYSINTFAYGSDWTGSGFRIQDIDNPSSVNFPTVGYGGKKFTLRLGNTIAQTVIDSTSTSPVSGSGVNLVLSKTSDNKVLITLNGPSLPSGGAFTPSTFEIKSGSKVIYRFTLNKWFMASGTYNSLPYSDAKTTCENVGYVMPDILDVTNGSGSSYGWVGTTIATGDIYQNATLGVDGKLIDEWGDVGSGYFWTSRTRANGQQYMVHGGGGSVMSIGAWNSYTYMCMSN